ncbi:hypothetical protein HPB49_004683 [Dermacentor silvarum]|uniref:Uncharacterized protein n=1 Tax=Dermacentor silvarum TaxID=543639 RepID=A0ACB8D2U0_DERSI|nr:hypothetical protein HPB49_004683 [Dermacentor silvarum]
MAREVDVLRREVVEMRKSLEMLNSLYEKVKQDQEALALDNKALKQENDHLVKRLAQQFSRINNIEIKGIPCTQGEDCNAILQKIGDKIGCPVAPADIHVSHRVPTKKDKKHNSPILTENKKG